MSFLAPIVLLGVLAAGIPIAIHFFFKSRFRPRYESRSLGVWPQVTLGSSWSFIQVIGVLNLHPIRFMHSLWGQVTGWLWKKRERAGTSV